MTILLLFTYLSFFSPSHLPDCYDLGQLVEEHNDPILTWGDHIEFTEEIWIMNGKTYAIKDIHTSRNLDKGEVRKRLNCDLSLFILSDILPYQFTTITLESDQGETSYVHLIHSNFTLLVINDNIWIVNSCSSRTSSPAITPSHSSQSTREIITDLDYSVSSIVHEEATFEVVTEQVLKKDAYTDFISIPATWDTNYVDVVVNQTNVCPEIQAEYKTTTETFIIQLGFDSVYIVPAQFELVTEQVLESEPFVNTVFDIPQVRVISDTISLANAHDTLDIEFDPNCNTFSQECFDYSVLTVPANDTIIKINEYYCNPPFELVQGWCILGDESQPVYGTRQYQKLREPAGVDNTIMQIKQQDVERTLITNVSSFPDSCIVNEIEKIPEILPLTGYYVESQYVPAEYEFRSYRKTINEGFIEITPPSPVSEILDITTHHPYSDDEQVMLSDQFMTPTFLLEVDNSLDSLGFSDGTLYERLFTFLKENDLPLFGFNKQALEKLNINLSLVEKNRLEESDFLPLYQTLLNEDDNSKFLQYVYTDDCETLDIISNTVGGTFIPLARNGEKELDIIQFFSGNQIEGRYGTKQHVIQDLTLSDCDSRFPITHVSADTLWLDILDIYNDDLDRKVIEFDIPILTCDETEENFKFIEGIGTNAGLIYDIKDGQVTSRLQCHTWNEELLFKAEDSTINCESIVSTEEIKKYDSKIYPNPVQDIITLPEGYILLSLTNSMGEKVPTNGHKEVNVAHLAEGFYVALLQSPNGHISSQKVLIVGR